MKWTPGDDGDDVIDRRGERDPGGGGGLGGGAMALLPLLLRTRYGWVVLLGIAALTVFRNLTGGGTSALTGGGQSSDQPAHPQDRPAQFVAFVLNDLQKTWDAELPVLAQVPYRHAKLVLFTDRTRTACGYGESATGPFYCPEDERVYIDLGFFAELADHLGAKGDFAQAYVIAHEIGHHVQKILGTSDRVHSASRSALTGPTGLSVRLELQADCFAGIWAHFSEERSLLESGDLEEALTAAQSIGDDRLQRQASGTVSPESFTHGTSAQRVKWLKRGHDVGTIAGCDTFSVDAP